MIDQKIKKDLLELLIKIGRYFNNILLSFIIFFLGGYKVGDKMLDQKIKKDLPELLIKKGYLTKRQLEKALQKAEEEGKELDKVLVELGYLTEKEITQLLAEQLEEEDVSLDKLREMVDEAPIAKFANLESGELEEEDISLDKLREMVDEDPIVELVNQIIFHAISDKASDIHIEPWPKEVVVRYRMDGILHEVMRVPKHLLAPMVSRIKIMSALDIAERRKPQDGKIHLKYEGRDFDLRVSTIPTVNGEKVVMQILDKSSYIT